MAKTYREKLEIFRRAQRIVESDLDWEEKYGMIFSDEVSRHFSFDYYDPDTSYEEDVRAFMSALAVHMEKAKIIATQIDLEEVDED